MSKYVLFQIEMSYIGSTFTKDLGHYLLSNHVHHQVDHDLSFGIVDCSDGISYRNQSLVVVTSFRRSICVR